MDNQQYRKPLSILLVDDSIHDYAAFQRAFDKSDVPARIEHETNAATALQRLVREGELFDLVVTDYRLGGMNGLELCREVLRLEIPVALVMLTGSGSEDLAVEALKAGVDDYLIKDPDQGYFQLLPVVLPQAVRRRNDSMVRKLAEETLAAGETRLRRILDAVSDGAWDWNVRTGQIRMTPRFYRMLGYEPDGIAASSWTWIDLLHPDDRDDVVARINEHLQRGEGSFAEEFRTPAQGDASRWVLTKAAVIDRTPDKQPLRVVGIILDVTERRLADDQCKRLREKVAAKERQLERFSIIIRNHFGPHLMAVETFTAELASLVDEIRQLLEAEPIDPAEKQHLTTLLKTGAGSDVGYIDAAVHDMRRLLDGVAQLTAAEQRPLNLETLDMDKILAEVCSALTETITSTQAQLQIDPLPPCRADYGWTKQIFIHLLSNALRNLDPQRPGRISVSASTRRDMVVYSVRDNGIGIEPERQKNLFDVLPPAPDTGRGLGLSIVARIIDRLEGQISVESEPGQGSCFHVSLPAVAAKLHAARTLQHNDSSEA